MADLTLGIDIREIKNSLDSCLKLSFSYLSIHGEELCVKITSSDLPLEDVITLGTVAYYFDLTKVRIYHKGSELLIEYKDISSVERGDMSIEDFKEKHAI